MNDCNCKDDGKFVAGVLLGALIGAAAGILLAPDKGEVTRKKVKKKMTEYLDKGKEILEEKKDEVKEVVKSAVDKALK